ncbi:MAG: hypothetical protein WDN44_04465 [Sphingomonas sp.]
MSARNMIASRTKPNFALWCVGYSVAYVIASGLDLWTTALALLRPDASEANVFATADGVYLPLRVLAVNAAGGIGMLAMFAFGLHYAERVSDRVLLRPMRSFLSFYINPWSRRAFDRSPLHLASYAIGFLVLRVLAAGNNLMIVAGGAGPLGIGVREAGRLSTPMIGFAAAMGAIYVLITVAVSPVAARILGRFRS